MAFVGYLFLAILAVASAAPGSRIVGGDHTTIEEYPFAIAFTYHYPIPAITIQRCVGALISSWHGLTSGFCFTGAVLENMQVRAGSTNSLAGGVVVNIANMVKHPGYLEVPRTDDIAVVFFDVPLGITSSINVLYLPPATYNIPDGTAVRVVSWGFESEQGPQLETLKTISVTTVSEEACQALYAESENVAISGDTICAGAPGRGVCLGDSGAPLVTGNVLLGTSSFFKECHDDEFPDVFTRVSQYTNWILEVAAAGRSGAGIRVAPATRTL